MRRSGFLFAVLCALAVPTAAQAHFLWATLSPSTKTVAIGLQEQPSDDALPLGERAAQVKAWSLSAKKIALKSQDDWLTGATKDDCVGASLDYGVLDKSEAGRGVFWLNYYAKAATSPAASQKKLGLPVEISLSKAPGGKALVTVFRNGKPAPGAEVVAGFLGGKATIETQANAAGTVTLPTIKGAFAIRALVTERTKGTHDGKAYDLIRSYCTLTVQDPASAGQPLTGLLRDSFGDNHDVVGDTAFIRTLMAGKLTKAQLRDHLVQRALIHEAVQDILLAAGSAKPLPYGDDQKRVLTLLRNDLATIGASWPAKSEAWPLTQDFLRELRESAKRGPYFALGIHHVYYGGITHGGRDIGAMIASTLKVNPTYYLKSDGYADYARKVNEILDPAAQREMIRGGKAAYRYIIAINDSKVFVTP